MNLTTHSLPSIVFLKANLSAFLGRLPGGHPALPDLLSGLEALGLDQSPLPTHRMGLLETWRSLQFTLTCRFSAQFFLFSLTVSVLLISSLENSEYPVEEILSSQTPAPPPAEQASQLGITLGTLRVNEGRLL